MGALTHGRTTITAVGAALLLVASAATAEETVTLTWRPPAEGSTRTDTKHMEMKLNLVVRLNGQVVQDANMSMREDEETAVTVQAVTGDAASKVQVEYRRAEKVQAQDQVEERATSPTLGKTYVVERKGEELTVTAADGSAPPEEEQEVVAKDQRDLGKPDRFFRLLPKEPVTVGQVIAVSPEDAREVFPPDDMEVKRFQLKLAGVQEGVARFEVEMLAGGEPTEGMTMTFDLKGDFLVRVADGRPLSLTLAGPMEMKGLQEEEGTKVEFGGKGTMSVRFGASYE
ncbi:MAG: hypothetical protein M9894_12965 [Planctomycetes bacterium]|nr:hypothetical protein [Planctomycetota bacterium]